MNLRNKVIKHVNNMDVCYQVLNCFDAGHKVICRADIINMGFVESFFLYEKCTIQISTDNMKDWLICSTPEVKCLRDANWRALR